MKDEIERKLAAALAPIAEEWAAYKAADRLCVELSRLNLAVMGDNRQEVSIRLQRAHKAAHRLRSRLSPAQQTKAKHQ